VIHLLTLAGLLAAPAALASEGDAGAEEKDRAVFAAPLVSYDTNLLLGVGAWSQVVWADPTGRGPYKASVAAQAFATTGGYQSHYLSFDLPHIGDSGLRWALKARRLRWALAPYLGLGNHTPREDPAAVPADYYTYDRDGWALQTSLRRALGGDYEVFASWSGKIEGVEASPTSLLALEAPAGAEGGLYAQAGLGLIYDGRDDEIDPTRGWRWDASVRGGHRLVGSEWVDAGVNASVQPVASLAPRLVFAARAMIDARVGETPFFERAFTGGLGRGVIGGRWILRGYHEERFRGDGLAAAQAELRWRFARWSILKKVDTAWTLAPFVDAGRTWLVEGEPDPWYNVHVSGGGGLRTNIKGLLVLRADVGVAFDEYLVDPHRRPQVQVYVLGDHPF